MAKNIEMSVLGSDGSYEVLYPYTIPSQVEDLLNNDTKVYIGLSEDSTPDDAFRQLFLANVLQNKSSLRIILQNQDGIRMGGVTITSEQFCDSKGNKTPSMTTNDEGIIDTFTDGETTTVNINTNYFEIAKTNTSWSTPLGEQLEETWTITTRNELTVTTSGNYNFSHNVHSFDACLVGGGGGGGGGCCKEHYDQTGGSGGGGGYVTNVIGVEVSKNNAYTCTIASGGTGGPSWRGSNGEDGNNGGTTILKVLDSIISQANGGNGGKGGVNVNGRDYRIEGGVGNGNGGASGYARSGGYIKENGSPGTVYKFNDSSLGLAGGGGGGGAGYGRGIKPGTSLEYGGTSGQPNTGGHGGYSTNGTNDDEQGYNGQNGGVPGGGGGGGTGMVWGGTYTDRAGNGGKGGTGIIYLRWTVQEVSA